MRLWLLRSEQRRQPQHFSRVASLSGFEIEQSEVKEQLPVVEPEIDRLLILGEFIAMLPDDAVRKTQVIVCERVGRIVADHHAMARDRLAVVFHPEKIVCGWIANLLVVGIGFGTGTRADRRLEYQRDRGNKKNARPAKAQRFSPSRDPRTRERNSDVSRNFLLKK